MMLRKRVRKKIKRSNIIVISFITIGVIFGFGLIVDTYGLFESNRIDTAMSDIAKWKISVNELNIMENTSFVVDSIVLDSNTSVKEGKIAPGGSGYFDILIDGKDTDVSFRYDVTFDFSNLDISKLIIEKIEEVNYGMLIKTGENTYTNVITLSDIKKGITNLIRVYVKWENAETANEEDSVIGLDSEYSLNIPVNITFTQYLGEDIIEYTE